MTTLLAAALLCLPACEKPAYPISYTFVEPKSGKALEANITGRTRTHVEFIRLKDSKFFSHPIDKLSPEDRKFVERLRLEKTDPSLLPKEPSPAYIQTRLDHVARLEKEIARLKLEIKNETDNPTALSLHKRQVDDRSAEILELQTEIEVYKLDRE